MSKLSQFSKNQKNQSFSNEKKKPSEEELKEKFDTYKDMSKEELNSQLFKEVARQKSQGTFDYNALENMVESLQGSLSAQDYNNIKRLLESLK